MKVVMINSVSGYGSTGSICLDIAMELEQQGHECYIAYGQVSRGYRNEFKIGTKLENHLHNVGSRLLGKQGYFTKNGTNKLIQFLKDYNPDIIHLHNLHGNYLNLEILFDYLNEVQKPVVWTLHDCWAFTGKCAHYTDVGCYKWQTQCKKCPQIKKYPPSLFFDRSELMFKDKIKWFTTLQKMSIITVSNWLGEEVRKSFLKHYKINTIYNWIDTTIFKPQNTDIVVKKYGLDTNKFTVLLVSASWHLADVKFQDLVQLSSSLPSDYQILVVGKIGNKSQLPATCITIDYVDSKLDLASLYSFADVYVHLSTEDTFGKVIAEAMSCGTPAIVYNSTVYPEIVNSDCGYVVEKRNTAQVVAAIQAVEQKTKPYYSENCINFTSSLFDMKTNIDQTICVYNQAMQS